MKRPWPTPGLSQVSNSAELGKPPQKKTRNDANIVLQPTVQINNATDYTGSQLNI
jgi:hypothetical protein